MTHKPSCVTSTSKFKFRFMIISERKRTVKKRLSPWYVMCPGQSAGLQVLHEPQRQNQEEIHILQRVAGCYLVWLTWSWTGTFCQLRFYGGHCTPSSGLRCNTHTEHEMGAFTHRRETLIRDSVLKHIHS